MKLKETQFETTYLSLNIVEGNLVASEMLQTTEAIKKYGDRDVLSVSEPEFNEYMAAPESSMREPLRKGPRRLAREAAEKKLKPGQTFVSIEGPLPVYENEQSEE